MSIKVTETVWEHSQQTGTALLMLQAIAWHANDNGFCWPSVATLARKCRISTRHAKRLIRQLEEAGEIAVDVGGGRGYASTYKVLLVNGDMPDTVSERKGDMQGQKGDIQGKTVTSGVAKGDTATSPEPSRNRHKERSRNREGHHEPAPAAADRNLLAFLKANGVGEPQSDEERRQLGHPATLTWLQATSYWPSYVNLGYLIQELGDQPDALALARAWSLWTASGNRKGNIVGVLDWYKELTVDSGWTPASRFRPSRNVKAKKTVGQMTPIQTFEGGGGIY